MRLSLSLRRVGFLSALLTLGACVSAPPVSQSQDILWAKFGHHAIDEVLMTWGTPVAESHLTDGSRLITYRRSTVYDAASPYERGTGCEVTLLAKSPSFRIENIAMRGEAAECSQLAQGKMGSAVYPYVPPPPPLYPYYRPGWR